MTLPSVNRRESGTTEGEEDVELCDVGLWAVLVTSFLSATLLPGGSEAVVVAFVYCHPEEWVEAVGLATLGNTAGGMTSYWIGRLFRAPTSFRHIETVRRYGSPSLFFAWTPFVGDLLCVTAGWLRVPWLSSTIWMAIGKAFRYLVVVGIISAI